MRAPSRVLWIVVTLLLGVATPRASHGDIGSLTETDDSADLVLQRADWSGFAPLSLEELLRHFAGISVSRRGGIGSPQYTNILGSLTGQVQLVLDGIDMNELDHNWSRFFGVPVSHIERILVWRTTDPVRIEIWTRESQSSQPVTDLDVARGDYVTRTRRVRFATPEEPVQASLNYEELLRGQTDFRVDRTEATVDGLGSYAGRARWIDARLVRPNDDRLRFRQVDFVDDSNGSYDSQTDATHTHRVLTGVRWSTSWLGRPLVLDWTNLTWDRSRRLRDNTTNWTDSRNGVGADWNVVSRQALEVQVQVRGASASTLQDPGPGAVRVSQRQWDAGARVSTKGPWRWQAWGAVHDNQRHGTSWSGRLRTAWSTAVWSASAEVGRGVSFAGTLEPTAPGTLPRSIGRYASAGLERRGGVTTLGLRVWAKDFDGRSVAVRDLFPLLGTGPRTVGGVVAQARWDGSRANWLLGLGAQLSWVPWVDGERGGLPHLQSELLARLARVDWFDGDLSVTLQAVWHAETERAYTSQTILGAYQETGFDINVRLLRRMVFFWHIANAWDVLFESHPDVLMPGRRNHIGVQVLLFD